MNMNEIIHCSLRVGQTQSFNSYRLLKDDAGKPYIEIGNDEKGKAIPFHLDAAKIIPDRAGRTGHFEYQQEISAPSA